MKNLKIANKIIDLNEHKTFAELTEKLHCNMQRLAVDIGIYTVSLYNWQKNNFTAPARTILELEQVLDYVENFKKRDPIFKQNGKYLVYKDLTDEQKEGLDVSGKYWNAIISKFPFKTKFALNFFGIEDTTKNGLKISSEVKEHNNYCPAHVVLDLRDMYESFFKDFELSKVYDLSKILLQYSRTGKIIKMDHLMTEKKDKTGIQKYIDNKAEKVRELRKTKKLEQTQQLGNNNKRSIELETDKEIEMSL